MKSDAVTQEHVVNTDLGLANTVTAVVMPAGTYQFSLKARTAAELRIHPNPHATGVYFTIPASTVHREQRLFRGNRTDANGHRERVLYVSSPTGANIIAEALAWT